MRYRFAPVAVLLLLAACAASPGLPAPMAARAGEVEVVARTGAWSGWPADLSRLTTPIHVRVVNRGATPVRVSHDDVALVAGGVRLPAVLPYEVRGVVYAPPPAALPSAGFSPDVADSSATPHWALRGSATAAEADPARVGEQFALPSLDMLDGALPEGVVPPGDEASGFVYFEPLGAGPAELSVRLIDGRTGQVVGRAVIPITLP